MIIFYKDFFVIFVVTSSEVITFMFLRQKKMIESL